jgi:hypothetical protein
MADTLDVITLAEAKQALNASPASTTDDALLASYVTTVSRRMDQLCGPIVKRTVTETFDGSCGTVLLRWRPVMSITSVVDTGTTLDPTTYTVTPATGVLRKVNGLYLSAFRWGIASVVVTYVAGRFNDTGSVQEPFRRATAMLLAHLFRPEHGAGSETFGGVEDYPGLPGFFLPNAVRGLLGDELQRTPGIA